MNGELLTLLEILLSLTLPNGIAGPLPLIAAGDALLMINALAHSQLGVCPRLLFLADQPFGILPLFSKSASTTSILTQTWFPPCDESQGGVMVSEKEGM